MAKGSEGPVPVVVMGLGFIGQALARAALASPELELIGAVDPQLSDRLLGEVVGRPGVKLKVRSGLAQALEGRRGVVVLQATHSRFKEVQPALMEIVRAGCHVVSTCEELTFPWLYHEAAADKLDRAAQDAGVVVLGTGVNPGFVMDRLVATAGQACGQVRHARLERLVDARTRREGLWRRIGMGLTEEAFFEQLEVEKVGLVGLVESAALCALGLGMDCDDFEEEIAPVLAEEDLPGAPMVRKGMVAGLAQTVIASEDGVERVRLEVTIAAGVDGPMDRITLDGDPQVRLRFEGGLDGDAATANVVINAAPRVTAAEPGILTVLELPAGR